MIENRSIEASQAESRELRALRGRIGWICHAIRVAALLYAVWLLYVIATLWTNVSRVESGYGRLLNRDLSGVSSWQLGAALGVSFTIWLVTAAACYSAWGLFTDYLRGSILTVAASGLLYRTAIFGVIAKLLDIAARPLISLILTWHFPQGQNLRAFSLFFQPNDLLTLLLLLAFLALAYVQHTAAEIACEHQQIV
jgi:hypothetical protein